MSKRLDELAEASYRAEQAIGGGDLPWSDLGEGAKDRCRAGVLAVLAALRDPTPEMIDSGSFEHARFGVAEITPLAGGGYRIEDYRECKLSDEHYTKGDEAEDASDVKNVLFVWKAMIDAALK